MSFVGNKLLKNMSEIYERRCGQKVPENIFFGIFESCYISSAKDSYPRYRKQCQKISQFVGQKTLKSTFFSKKNVDFGAVVMATSSFFENLADCITMLADGTFKTSPEPFAQLRQFLVYAKTKKFFWLLFYHLTSLKNFAYS